MDKTRRDRACVDVDCHWVQSQRDSTHTDISSHCNPTPANAIPDCDATSTNTSLPYKCRGDFPNREISE